MTNGDRIRQMSNEELWKVLHCVCCIYRDDVCDKMSCRDGMIAYLESEEE